MGMRGFREIELMLDDVYINKTSLTFIKMSSVTNFLNNGVVSPFNAPQCSIIRLDLESEDERDSFYVREWNILSDGGQLPIEKELSKWFNVIKETKSPVIDDPDNIFKRTSISRSSTPRSTLFSEQILSNICFYFLDIPSFFKYFKEHIENFDTYKKELEKAKNKLEHDFEILTKDLYEYSPNDLI